MFREMRRKERELGLEDINKILTDNNYCVLSLKGDNGFPYGVPVNYGFVEGKFYIHGTSKESHKLDSIKKDSKVCITVVSKNKLEAEKFMTYYSSVIVFGNARIIDEPIEKTEAMYKMMMGISTDLAEKAVEECKKVLDSLVMIEVTPEHMTGKEVKE